MITLYGTYRTAVRTVINVYINRISDLIDFMRRREKGKEIHWRGMKRSRGAMKSLDKINYYIIIGIDIA